MRKNSSHVCQMRKRERERERIFLCNTSGKPGSRRVFVTGKIQINCTQIKKKKDFYVNIYRIRRTGYGHRKYRMTLFLVLQTDHCTRYKIQDTRLYLTNFGPSKGIQRCCTENKRGNPNQR